MQIGAYEMAQREKARALKAKFYGRKIVQVGKAESVALIERPQIEWRNMNCWFNEHVIAFRKFKAWEDSIRSFQVAAVVSLDAYKARLEIERRPMHKIAEEVLQSHPGIGMADIKGRRRTRVVVTAKHAVIRAIVEERPDLSFPTIGRFMHMDHTSILHAAGKLKKKPTTLVRDE